MVSITKPIPDGERQGQRVHSVPAAPQLLDLLRQLQALQGDPQPDDRVFQGVEGAAMDGSALYRRYRQLQTAAGVRALRFHTSATRSAPRRSPPERTSWT